MTWICGYEWCWLCKGKYSSSHYKPWNIFGWASMQYTVDWNKCSILIYYTFLMIILFPLFLLCCPLIYMIRGVYEPWEDYDNCFSNFWIIPTWWYESSYEFNTIKWCAITLLYLPFVIALGLIFGSVFLVLWWPFAILVTLWKMVKLSLRDWRCLQYTE